MLNKKMRHIQKKNIHRLKTSSQKYYFYSSQIVFDSKKLVVLPRLESRFPQ